MRASLDETVIVWSLDLEVLPEAAWTALGSLLADEERQAVARFARPDDRRGAAAARALAKGLLGVVTGSSAGTWRLQRTAGGAPLARAADGRRPPWLSLSRTRGAVAAAVSTSGAVGVDIERMTEAEHGAAVAQALFAPVDLATMDEAGDAAEAFTRVWTVKEAVLKALGTGFALPPAHVGVLSLDPCRIGFAPGYPAAPDWTVRSSARGPFRMSAACRSGAGDTPILFEWVRVSPANPPKFEPCPGPSYQ